MSLFLSYCRDDLDKVLPVKQEIEQILGVSCWMDDGKRPEDEVIDAIVAGDAFLFMLTPQSMSRSVVFCELDYASRRKEHIVLVALEPCELDSDFAFRYGHYEIIQWNEPAQRLKLLLNLRNWCKK
jgi:hypothetical protein